ncbi:MAG: hypothetical protein IJ272_06960 [Clostridia bacterium]|nr:hypothetical protein [Clostridia bacterium]
MINGKKHIIETVNDLSEDAICNNTIYDSYFSSKLKKSEEDIKNGRVITLEELKRYIDRLEENDATGNI